MKLFLLLSTIGIGFLVTFHISMNAWVGTMTQNALLANAMFWLIGAISAMMLAVMKWDRQFITHLNGVPKWLLFAGVIGAVIAFFTNLLIPKIGIYKMTIFVMFGQVVTSMLFSHYGIFTQNAEPVNFVKIFGSLLSLLGAVLIIYGKIPFFSR